MICMGVDSAGRTAGVALMRDDELLFECHLNGGLTHSQTLMGLIDTAFRSTGLTPADVDLYGVCSGPGSFTGLRIGLAAVKGLAFAQDTPCAPVSTLEALALSHVGEGTVLPALDARRREVYWAAFDLASGQRLVPDSAAPLTTLQDFVETCKKPLFFVGDGAQLCYNEFDSIEGVLPCPAALRVPRTVGVCLAAMQMHRQGLTVPPAELLPSYHRLSQAERERQQTLTKEICTP